MADYPEEFVSAVNDVLKWEGGYVDDPKDSGGETNMGISRRQYPDIDIKDLTRNQAIAIYFRDYWVKPGIAEKIPDPAMRAKVFNMGVVMGPLTALGIAAKSVNLDEFKILCADHFRRIVAAHPKDAKFLQGWLRRAAA
jgi:lysozyme family protein